MGDDIAWHPPQPWVQEETLEPALKSGGPLLSMPYSQRRVPSCPGEGAGGLRLLPGGLQAVPAGLSGSLCGGGLLPGRLAGPCPQAVWGQGPCLGTWPSSPSCSRSLCLSVCLCLSLAAAGVIFVICS